MRFYYIFSKIALPKKNIQGVSEKIGLILMDHRVYTFSVKTRKPILITPFLKRLVLSELIFFISDEISFCFVLSHLLF